jgi:transposase
MLVVETIRKIRLLIQRDGNSIRNTAKELGISRNTVRKALRTQQTAFSYRRRSQPRPVLRAFAFQFDWSHELVEMAGMPVTVKVAQLRLCHSRHFLVVAYPRETQEMVFDAHMQAFDFFGGVCRRGIYDNLKTVVNKILAGKERNFNNRFGQLCSHYLFEPVACTPAAGWEKGQVENQVGTVRRRFFVPRPKVRDFSELNEYLRERCLQWAKSHPHPDFKDQSVWQVFEAERPHLIPLPPHFDGYGERPARVSPSSLVSFDRNRYSVDCHHVGSTVQLRVYAERIVIVWEGQVVGDHRRAAPATLSRLGPAVCGHSAVCAALWTGGGRSSLRQSADQGDLQQRGGAQPA